MEIGDDGEFVWLIVERWNENGDDYVEDVEVDVEVVGDFKVVEVDEVGVD